MLFQPITIGTVTLRNRVVMPSMVSNMGVTSPQGIAWYRERARGGVGLIIAEATWLQRFHAPEFAQGLRRLVDAVKSEGAAIAIQLFQPAEINGEPVAVSGQGGKRQPTAPELRQLVGEYARAAAVCRDAGFDGVEPHGAHGFFLNQFFSPRHNHRSDDYGGSLANRMRFALEVAAAIRGAIGSDRLLLYRHTPKDAAGGYPLEDTLALAPELVRAGVDALDISPSSSAGNGHCDLAQAVKRSVPVPVIAVGGMRYAGRAETALREGKADLVALGRQLIADPYWPAKVRDGRHDTIIECRECDEGCFGGLRRGQPIGCVRNADSGNEYLREPLGG